MLVLGVSGKVVAAYAFQSGIYHGWSPDWQSVVERSFWAQADLFAFGMALAVLRVDAEDGQMLRASRYVRTMAVPVGLLAYFVTAKMTDTTQQLTYSFYNTLMAVAFTCLLAFVVLPPRTQRTPLFLRALETPILVWAGLISYSVFLWHEPVVRWRQGHGLTLGGAGGLALNILLLLGLTSVLALLTYRWVELPALRQEAATNEAPSVPQLPAEQARALH
jgi:peptidoglycan/LPS O-acetylase OafA/YrhL